MMRHVTLQGSAMGFRGTQWCVGGAIVALIMKLIVCSSDPSVVIYD